MVIIMVKKIIILRLTRRNFISSHKKYKGFSFGELEESLREYNILFNEFLNGKFPNDVLKRNKDVCFKNIITNRNYCFIKYYLNIEINKRQLGLYFEDLELFNDKIRRFIESD